MRQASVLLWLLACGMLAGRLSAETALTLDEVFAAALKRSEAVATQVELIRQAEERSRQATAALLPTVSGVATHTRQDDPPATASTSVTPSILARQTQAKLTASQPLFRGFREFAALRQTQALRDAQGADYRNARVLLFKDVAENYYNVLSIEQELRNLAAEIDQNQERVRDIEARIRIGRSRQSELLNVQATLSALHAEVEQLQGQLRVARETFAFLSGLDGATPLRDSETPPATLEPLDRYLTGIEARPDAQASRQRLSAAHENVKIAEGAHWPSLDLNGNYYFKRPGYLDDISWDVQLALTVPLYAGGSLQSKVRESASQQTQAELTASEVRRRAEQEIRSFYQSVQAGQSRLAALEKSTDAARQSYEAQRREYRLGLVTNLDVLLALTAYQQNQRALDRARFAVKLDALRLQVAAGRRSEIATGTR